MRISSLFSVLNDALTQRLGIAACGAAFARLQSLQPLATCLLVWVRTASRSLRALSSPRHQVVISTFRQARSHSMAQGQALHSRFKLATTSLATVLRARPGLVTTLVRYHDSSARPSSRTQHALPKDHELTILSRPSCLERRHPVPIDLDLDSNGRSE